MQFEENYKDNKDVIAAIVASYGNDLHTQEDLNQEIWAHILEKMPLFNGRSTFRTWACAIAFNVCNNHLRYQKVRSGTILDADIEWEGEDGGTYVESYCDESSSPEEILMAYQSIREYVYSHKNSKE